MRPISTYRPSNLNLSSIQSQPIIHPISTYHPSNLNLSSIQSQLIIHPISTYHPSNLNLSSIQSQPIIHPITHSFIHLIIYPQRNSPIKHSFVQSTTHASIFPCIRCFEDNQQERFEDRPQLIAFQSFSRRNMPIKQPIIFPSFTSN